MVVTSSTFSDGGTIPNSMVSNQMGFQGENRSPQLSWSEAPEATRSFAIVAHDPDAPTSGGFYHWVMFDIPAGTTSIDEGHGNNKVAPLFTGERLGRNDMGKREYDGPAPPPGPAHRYHFTVFALDVDKLPVPGDSSGAFVEFNAGEHTLAKATITGKYAASE